MSMSNAAALHRITTTSVRRGGARPWWFAGEALLVVDQQCGVAGLAPRHGAGTATPNRISPRRRVLRCQDGPRLHAEPSAGLLRALLGLEGPPVQIMGQRSRSWRPKSR